MTSTINHVSTKRRRLLPLLLTASCVVAGAMPIGAQQPPTIRMWAAQTAPNQVTLAWEEIPGAVEYRIYAGDPDTASSPAARRPISTLSGSGRGGIITGMNRVSSGLYLEAVGRDRRRIRKLAFNAVAPTKSAPVVAAPAEVTATAIGDAEITLSWTPVAGATAYMLGRAVSPGGYAMLCALCPTDPKYVDRDATPGAAHSYTVAAVFPNGLSPRTTSNLVTPGTVAGVADSTIPGGASQSTGGATTGGGSATDTASHTVVPAPTKTWATVDGRPPGTAWVVWTVSSSVGVTGFILYRNINGGGWSQVRSFGTNVLGTLDSVPAAQFAAGPVNVSYRVAATGAGGTVSAPSSVSPQVLVTPPSVAATPGTGQPSTGVVVTSSCKLDYQRADNMWAPLGKPVGNLGTESITLLDGQTKLFFTDWKYEKLRNDGTNYYGSHLRIATNAGARWLKVQIQTQLSSSWVTIKGGETFYYQHDLAQVSCTG
jgi:hypothetical protein